MPLYVKEAAKVCREGNARPDMLPCMLLMRRNGGKITKKTLETVMRVTEDKTAGKALTLYVSAYEKMKERRSVCLNRFESLITDAGADADVLNILLGADESYRK